MKLFGGIAVMLALSVGWLTGALEPLVAMVLLACALLVMPPILLFHGASRS